jgi:hypothetical protein
MLLNSNGIWGQKTLNVEHRTPNREGLAAKERKELKGVKGIAPAERRHGQLYPPFPFSTSKN